MPSAPPSQIAVCLVADGRENMAASTKQFLEKEMGIWDDSMVVHSHLDNDVTCHIFQRTVCLTKRQVDPEAPVEYYLPLQFVLLVKEKNGGKLNSHLWFFAAVAPQVTPEVIVVRTHSHPIPPCVCAREAACSNACFSILLRVC